MEVIVACVPKEYDLSKIRNVYPHSAIYVTTKTESEDKVKEQIYRNRYIIYDSDQLSDVTEKQIEYAKSLENKSIMDIKGVNNG